MKKNNQPVIPVIKTKGKVTSYLIEVAPFSSVGISKSSEKVSTKISKASSQNELAKFNYDFIPPIVDPVTAVNLFKQNPFHMRAIIFKASCCVGQRIDILPIDPLNKNFENDPEYIKLKTFLDGPNDEGELSKELAKNLYIDYYIHGQGYLEIVENKKNELAEIYNLRAYNTFAKLYYNHLYYIQRVAGTDVWFRPYHIPQKEVPNGVGECNGILVLKGYDPSTKYYGMPEWYSATADLVLNRSIDEYRIRKFENNLMIQFMIICEGGEIDNDGLQGIKTFLSRNYMGTNNAGKVLYLNSDQPDVKIRIEKIESDNREIDFIRSRDQLRDFILAAHGVPSALMGIKVPGQLGGTTEIKDLLKVFYETVIKFDKERGEALLTRLFKSKLGITKFKIEFKELDVDSLKDLVEMIDKMVGREVIDTDEGRSILGWEPRNNNDPNLEKNLNNDGNDILYKLFNVRRDINYIRKNIERKDFENTAYEVLKTKYPNGKP
jgi:HK97 family phage portal protein